MHDADLAIVGAGFGGSILAMVARRLGLRVYLLERGRHPRFAIGESASPLAGVILEQLAERYDLPRLRPLAAFGSWREAYPDLTCGLKRGFTYFKHEAGRRYRSEADRSNQLLVAASPSEALSDTHWLRSDVDHFLVREAAAMGVEYVDEVTLEDVEWRTEGGTTLTGHRCGACFRLRVRGVVDASGPNGFLARLVGGPGRSFDGFPATQALFSHFAGVARCDGMPDYTNPDGDDPPYPMDDAALHHVFDGGWMWVLRFGNGVTSAGVAVTEALAQELRLADGAPAWQRMLDRYPSVAAQFAESEAIQAFTWMPRVASRAPTAAGSGWALLPSAAALIDPLFSTGFPLTLLGIERLAGALERGALVDRADDPSLDAYSAITLGEADHTARFVSGCYAAFPRFEAFTAYAMLYFVAASFGEMSRRVRPDVTSDAFLRADDAGFAATVARLSPARGVCHAADLAREIEAATRHLNVAGLGDPVKRNWYGMDVEDAVRGCHKLGVTPERVRAVLGWQQ